MRVQGKIIRVGGTQAVAIPVAVIRELGWEIGDAVELEVSSCAVTIIEPSKHKTIKEIAKRLVRENTDTIKWLAEH